MIRYTGPRVALVWVIFTLSTAAAFQVLPTAVRSPVGIVVRPKASVVSTAARKRGAKEANEVDPFDPDGTDGTGIFKPWKAGDEDRQVEVTESDKRLFMTVITVPFLVQVAAFFFAIWQDQTAVVQI